MAAKKLFSLVFVRRDNQILLGKKKRGFGQGKWNGFGGKVEPNETPLVGGIRELREECGLIGTDLRTIGLLHFEFEGEPTLMEVHVFETFTFAGELTESDEMRPQWYDVKNIPYDKMWLDDIHWYPYMLRSELFKGYFLYRGTDFIVKYKIDKIEGNELKGA
ncbi:7,8-dihydro-8-oxoguanine triphosphatase [Copidosoma floridanum]|uniref:7,8-dihydro-8-oxoguanine triphosphatase n=1 Tax=Copidosoma floridanum TaxID=29053 RepID=UPI0006C9913B|nr:7,8-dihydro-8-oxoguanine triphosphatase [Copidosoma floridanum]